MEREGGREWGRGGERKRVLGVVGREGDRKRKRERRKATASGGNGGERVLPPCSVAAEQLIAVTVDWTLIKLIHVYVTLIAGASE
jgi:hypothetical protein